MVSFWPWKGEDNSPASFEKALSALSAKITQTTTQVDVHRQSARRFKALWTLYTTFAYLLYSIIVALVLGWQNWDVIEYSALAGGPVLIYAVRAGASKFFDYRINKTQRYLDGLRKQRDETIEKLKAATKYNSTQQLLEKYAEESAKPSRPKGGDEKQKADAKGKPPAPQQPVMRTGLPPPPTANIQRRTPDQPLGPPPSPPFELQTLPQQIPPPPLPAFDAPGFAPNAFPPTQHYVENSHWYDRLLDVLLGEDETQPKNRMVLICTSCRLVNGQAPPGIKTLEELGRWRCGGCGAWNGEESEAEKVLDNIRNQSQPTDGAWDPVSNSDVTDEGVLVAASEDDQVESRSSGAESVPQEEAEESEPVPEPTRKSTRGHPKGSKKKG